jgi:hypothetical protein
VGQDQRRGEYRPALSRSSFQTSPHVRHRQYEAVLTLLLVVVRSFDRHAGHTLGGWTMTS